MEWPPWPFQPCKAPHRTASARHNTSTHRTIPGRLQDLRIEKAEINKSLAENTIKPVQTEWAASIVLVTKTDRTLRFCVDNRKLNTGTERDSYLIHCMNEWIDSLGKQPFSRRYTITAVCSRSNSKTLTKTRPASHCITVHITSSACALVKEMSPAHSKVLWTWSSQCSSGTFALVLQDDILIFSKTPEQHIDHICKVFSLLYNVKATLKLKNRYFFTNRIDFMRRVICL